MGGLYYLPLKFLALRAHLGETAAEDNHSGDSLLAALADDIEHGPQGNADHRQVDGAWHVQDAWIGRESEEFLEFWVDRADRARETGLPQALHYPVGELGFPR